MPLPGDNAYPIFFSPRVHAFLAPFTILLAGNREFVPRDRAEKYRSNCVVNIRFPAAVKPVHSLIAPAISSCAHSS